MIRRREWTAQDLDALEARVEELEAALDELAQQQQQPPAGDDLDRQLKQLLVGLLASRAISTPAQPQQPAPSNGGQQQ